MTGNAGRMRKLLILFGIVSLVTFVFSSQDTKVFFQAHRGAVDEAPENTLAAIRHAWQFPGAVPEVDVRSTRDGVLVCLHDTSLARTTNAPEAYRDKNIAELSWEQLRNLDAGGYFNAGFKGEKIPTLEQVFAEMTNDPGRLVYLDVKDADMTQLKKMIDRYGLGNRIIFVHGDRAKLVELKRLFPASKTMTWISGEKPDILRKYAEFRKVNFEGIDQLQLHLKARKKENEIVYLLDDEFLARILDELKKRHKELQVRPFLYDVNSMKRLLSIGIKWYVTDAPENFYRTLQKAMD